MTLNDFIAALQAAGWRPTLDAQHTCIRALHRRLWPVIADLEEERDALAWRLSNAQEGA